MLKVGRMHAQEAPARQCNAVSCLLNDMRDAPSVYFMASDEAQPNNQSRRKCLMVMILHESSDSG